MVGWMTLLGSCQNQGCAVSSKRELRRGWCQGLEGSRARDGDYSGDAQGVWGEDMRSSDPSPPWTMLLPCGTEMYPRLFQAGTLKAASGSDCPG